MEMIIRAKSISLPDTIQKLFSIPESKCDPRGACKFNFMKKN